MGPLIDEGCANVISAYVEPKSKRSARAKKAILYVEIKVCVGVKTEDKDTCTILLLGGDQIRMWAQKLAVIRCAIPLEHAKLLFEATNRYCFEYKPYKDDMNFSYAGLDYLVGEILNAHKKRMENMEEGVDYSEPEERKGLCRYILQLAQENPQRYGELAQYISDDFVNTCADLNKIFYMYELDRKEYYWLDHERVDEETFDSVGGFYHWYDVMELYASEKDLPFDLSDEDVECIFGFNRFIDFVDLSYGC